MRNHKKLSEFSINLTFTEMDLAPLLHYALELYTP